MTLLNRMLSRSTLRSDSQANHGRTINGYMLSSPSADCQWRWNPIARKYHYSFYAAK